jgi:hypothetical protein
MQSCGGERLRAFSDDSEETYGYAAAQTVSTEFISEVIKKQTG